MTSGTSKAGYIALSEAVKMVLFLKQIKDSVELSKGYVFAVGQDEES